jgi:hypothetical protein
MPILFSLLVANLVGVGDVKGADVAAASTGAMIGRAAPLSFQPV